MAVVVFAVDLYTPGGTSLEHLHLIVVLLGLLTTWKPYVALATLGVSVLAVVPEFMRTPDFLSRLWFLNVVLTPLPFVLVALFVIGYQRLQAADAEHIEELRAFKAALDQAAIVATTGVDGRITYVNDKFCEISGYAPEELLGQDHRLINSAFHSKDFIRDLWRTIASGRVWKGEIRNRAKNGQWYWVDTTIVPFLDARGRPYRYIAIRADITARKRAEAELVRQESLARVGQLAAMVAHEVRNPLAGIKGVMQILISRRRSGDAEVPLMREVVGRIDALSDLISDLMVFARPREARMNGFDLRPLLEDLVVQARRDPAVASLQIDIHGDAAVEGDSDLIRSAVTNLLLNAAQAMSGQGRVLIRIDDAKGGSERDAQANTVTIEVQDDGPGIPEELRGRVMEPFFTTKSRGGGLGLAIAQRTAEVHGGSLTLICPDGGGTIARLALGNRVRTSRE